MSIYRYYLCDLWYNEATESYEPVVSKVPNVSFVAAVDADPETGLPLYPDCIVLVKTDNHAVIRALPGVDPMPDLSLDDKMANISSAAKNAMVGAMQRRRLSTQQVNTTTLGYREVLDTIGKQRSASFNIDKFYVK